MTKPNSLAAEDLNMLNRMMPLYPEFHETVMIVKRVIEATKFPINSYDDLAESLGGEDATITFRGRTMTVGEIRKMVPAYYFPFSSEKDLIAKISDLRALAGKAQSIQVPPLTEGIEAKWARPLIELPHNTPTAPPLTTQQVCESVKNLEGVCGVARRPV